MAADSSRGGSSAPTSATLNDGTLVKVNDHVYLAPEHLGECYYIGRIMEFVNQPQKKGLMARIAWFYRPKDVLTRRNIDPYLLLATMHSDLNPVSSIRGRCYVTHKYYIPEKDMDAYKAAGDHFYYNQLFDKFTLRVYDVIPCETVRNVPKEIVKAMNEKFQFIVVEQQRAVELTSEQKVCVVCSQWCAASNSVKCSACKNNYHMECLNPPLMRKPSKGFAWECAWCTKKAVKLSPEELKQLSAEEQKQLFELDSPPPTPQTPNTPSQAVNTYSSNEHKPISPSVPVLTSSSSSKSRSTPASRSATPSQVDIPKDDSPRKVLTRGQESEKKIKSGEKQFPMTKMWPFRYFGIHTNINDIFDSEDRLNPRANSSIGPKHQAVVPDWSENGPASNGEPYTNIAPSDKSTQGNRHGRNRKTDKRGPRKHRITQEENTGESSMNAFVNGMPKRKSNGYLDEEPSVTRRGTSDTITVIFNRRENFTDEQYDAYMDAVKKLPSLPVSPQSSDLMDRALLELEHNNYNVDKALKKMSALTEEDLDIGHWTPEEIANFEKGIKTYGHDMFSISKSIPNKKMKDIVRHFYKWKKTPRYEPVYSEWTTIYKPGKKFRNRGLETSSKTPTAEDSEASEDEEGEDDADPTVVPLKGAPPEGYQCTNCGTMDSALWRRSPGDTERRRRKFLKVLCDRCGVYWLKYGVMRVVTEAELKRRGRKPKMEGTSKEEGKVAAKRKRMFNDPNAKFPKKVKDSSSRDRGRERSPSPFLPTPCTVCLHMEPLETLLTCRDCGMSVHKGCYGELDHDIQWRCDICNNNKNPTASTTYQCVLCSKPATGARQALKRTSGNNWAHVLCSIYIPEIRFTHAKELQVVEGIGNINSMRWNQVCAICQVPNKGACISGCDFCKIPVHVTCAQDAYYKVGFEMQTVKASRNVFNIPSTCFKTGGGFMVPQIWCPKHDLTNARVVDLTETNKDTLEPALMTYATTYKQSDQSSAGAMRKSRLVSSAATNITNPANTSRRRSSLTSTVNRKSAIGKAMSHPPPQCKCVNCGVCVSPVWWDIPEKSKIEEDKNSELVTGIAGFNSSVINGHGKTNGIKAEEGIETDVDVMANSVRSVSQDRESEASEELVQKKLCQKCYWGKRKENGSVLSFGNGSSLV